MARAGIECAPHLSAEILLRLYAGERLRHDPMNQKMRFIHIPGLS